MFGAYFLLADGNPFSHLGRNLRGGSGRLAMGELFFMVGILAAVGIYFGLLIRRIVSGPLVPLNDPRMPEALNHRNYV